MVNRVVSMADKQRRGTDQPARSREPEIEFEQLTEAPQAPDWLPVHAKSYFQRIVPLLMAKRVLTQVDEEALHIMCMAYGKIRQAAEAGADLNASLLAQLRLYQTEFGLTPASRAKITKGPDGGKGNAFGKNGQQGQGPKVS